MAEIQDNELDSTIMNDDNDNDDGLKSNVWEYEAPHYFDFNKMDNQQSNDGDDNYFLVNHEYNDDNDHNAESKENVMDESSQSFYQTPDLKLAKTMSNVVYELRQTPLRRLHQNGNLPYRETRSNVGEFNKRKSYSHRKSMKTIRFDKEFETQTFDFSQMSEVLDGVSNDNGDSGQLSNQEKITTDTVDDKQNLSANNDETIADKPVTNGTINEDLLSENEDLLSENEEPEDNFHEISTDDLEQPKSSIVDNVNDRSEIDSNPDQSYLVTSPVVRIVIADNENECLPEDIESTDIMKTPPPMNEAEQRKLKIKNCKPTPMFGILRHQGNKKNTETTTKKMVTIDNNDRSQKYWKRFSRTLNQDDGNDTNDKIAIDEKSKNVAVVDGKENRKQSKVTIEDSKKDATPQPKKSLSTNNVSHKSLSMATINRLSTLPQRILSERYISMAEQTQRFLHSARQYQPKGVWQRNKLTKPRPPRLLTAIRSECRRKIEAESNRIATLTSSSSIETTDSEATVKSA